MAVDIAGLLVAGKGPHGVALIDPLLAPVLPCGDLPEP